VRQAATTRAVAATAAVRRLQVALILKVAKETH
jgi:hypothetical protein